MNRDENKPSTPHRTPDETLHWEPLGNACPSDWLPVEEGIQLLSAKHLSFIQQLLAWKEEGSYAAARRGLHHLDTVPPQEERTLDLTLLRIQFLVIQGESLRADAVFFDYMFGMNNELLWVHRGRWILDWLHQNPQHVLRESLLSSLRLLCTQTQWAAPCLILAHALSQQAAPHTSETFDLSLWQTALDPMRWKSHPERISLWLEPLALGFYQCVWFWKNQGDLHQARSIARTLLQFPWSKHKTFSPAIFSRLCMTFEQAQLPVEQKNLCEQMIRQYKSWPEPHAWLVPTFLNMNKGKKALFHLQQALNMGELADSYKISVGKALLQHRQHKEVHALLSTLKNPDTLDALQLQIAAALYEEQLVDALQLCEQSLAIYPQDRISRMYCISILEALGRWQEAESMLRPWIHSNEPPIQAFAHFLLGRICLQTDRWQEAYDLFQFLLTEPHTYTQILSKNWQKDFLVAYATCLRRMEQFEEALSFYHQAENIEPSLTLSLHILWLLIEKEQWDEVNNRIRTWNPSLPDSPWFSYAKILALFSQKQWRECLDTLHGLSLSWIEQQGLTSQRLWMQAKCLSALESPWDALMFCEKHLEQFLADPDLRSLRQQIIAATATQFEHMTSRLGKQHQQLQELDTLQQQLHQHQQLSLQREKVWQGMLAQQHWHGVKQVMEWESSWATHTPSPPRQHTPASTHHQTITTITTTAPTDPVVTTTPWPVSSTVMKQWPVRLRSVLESAAFLWEQLAQHPQQDHGPVVLQLARVLEGEVNQRLIDPLVSFALEHGWSLSDLPPVASGKLAHEHNRISLGDASMLLYHELEQQEPDGSTTIVKNPRSNPVFREILQQFWSKSVVSLSVFQKDFLQNKLPLALQEIAKWRNRASHAGTQEQESLPISRKEALNLIHQILGSSQSPGVLPQLFALS